MYSVFPFVFVWIIEIKDLLLKAKSTNLLHSKITNIRTHARTIIPFEFAHLNLCAKSLPRESNYFIRDKCELWVLNSFKGSALDTPRMRAPSW